MKTADSMCHMLSAGSPLLQRAWGGRHVPTCSGSSAGTKEVSAGRGRGGAASPELRLPGGDGRIPLHVVQVLRGRIAGRRAGSRSRLQGTSKFLPGRRRGLLGAPSSTHAGLSPLPAQAVLQEPGQRGPGHVLCVSQ